MRNGIAVDGIAIYILIGRAQYKWLDKPVLIWDVPPDVTITR